MNRITNKLRSDSGASITFALLLFLVCAILSAVILVAGTIAAGRMSNLAETDQCYYSVTSAAELIKDMLDGQKVSVIGGEVINKPMDTITEYDIYYDNNSEKTSADDNVEPETSDGTAAVAESSDLAVELAKSYRDKGEGASSKEYELSSNPEIQGLKVSITEYMDEQGNVEFTINNSVNKKYTMKLQFAIEEKNCKPPVDRDIPDDSKEISWHLTNMESAYDAS